MGKFLEAFASGNLRMDCFVTERLPEHDEIDTEASALQEKLAKGLDEEEKVLLEKLVETMNAESGCFGIENLIRGYRLGVIMTTEVYLEQDRYWKKGEGEV